MGGGHVCGQLALFFGLHQPKPGLTLSSAVPWAVSVQTPSHLAQPTLLVAKGWDVAVPHHSGGPTTASNATAGWAHRMVQGQGCCIRTFICTPFSGAGPDPSLSTLAVCRGIFTSVTWEPAFLHCCSTAGRKETATNPWHAGFLLAFIFTDA